MSASSIHEQFVARQAAELGRAAWRQDALARFESIGFPTRKTESWRYTDLKPLSDAAFDLVPPEPGAATARRVAELLDGAALGGPDDARLVFVDGHVVPSLSRAPSVPGVEAVPLVDDWPAFERALEQRNQTDETGGTFAAHPLAALNTAFVRHGAMIRLARDTQARAPVHLIFVATGAAGAAPQPRIVVEIGQHARGMLVQHFIDLEPAAPGWLNLVTEIRQAPGSRLELYRLQEHSREQHQTSLLEVRLSRDAALEAGYMDLGGALVRNDIDVVLAEPGARVDLFGLALSGARQHTDNHLRIDHAAPRTTSRESFRAIVAEHGHGVFNGKVIVRPGAQQIDARQTSDNLLLSNKAEIDTKPELEIYADDVKCSHGATIGELDADHLFYLRSRGMDETAARGLLMFAFANVSIARFPSPALRRRAALRVAGQLPEAIDWESLT